VWQQSDGGAVAGLTTDGARFAPDRRTTAGTIEGQSEHAMGRLQYNNGSITIDDRALAHLQIVIVNHLRKGNSLTLSWLNSLSRGDGRSSIWLHPAIPLQFDFAGSRRPEIDREWIDRLEQSASSSIGLVVLGADGKPLRCESGASR
jgi:hypothetical protein